MMGETGLVLRATDLKSSVFSLSCDISHNLETAPAEWGRLGANTHFRGFHWSSYDLISHASKVMLKILQARLQQCMNHEHPDVQAGFRKGRGTRDQIAKSIGSSKKQESSRKTSTSALLTVPKPLIVWTTTNSGKFLKRWEYQTTWSDSQKSVCRSKSNS